MRDNFWLTSRLNYFLQTSFSDVELKNNLRIFFGRKARTRLGSIQFNSKNRETIIRITAYFKDEKIPQYVVDSVIIHEMIHYAHGFSSPLTQCFRYPHQGGVIKKEMTKRGLENYFFESKIWLKRNWPSIIKSKSRKRKQYRRSYLRQTNFTLSKIFKVLINF